MEKYLAKLMFNINIDNGNDASQFDEQVRIIESRSLEDAFYKARVIGKKEEESEHACAANRAPPRQPHPHERSPHSLPC